MHCSVSLLLPLRPFAPHGKKQRGVLLKVYEFPSSSPLCGASAAGAVSADAGGAAVETTPEAATPAETTPEAATPAAAASAAAALSAIVSQVEALESAAVSCSLQTPSGVCTSEEVRRATSTLKTITSLLLQMLQWRSVPSSLLSASHDILLRSTTLFHQWTHSNTQKTPKQRGLQGGPQQDFQRGPHRGPPRGGGLTQGASLEGSCRQGPPPSSNELLLLQNAWHIASGYLETLQQLQQQQQQQQKVMQLLLQRKAGDSTFALMLADDLLLLQQYRRDCLSNLATRISSLTGRTAETQQTQQQQVPWDIAHLQRAHGVSAAETAAAAAALLQQGVAAATVLRVASSLLSPFQGACTPGESHAPFSLDRSAAGQGLAEGTANTETSKIQTVSTTAAAAAAPPTRNLGAATHLLLARAFAEEGCSSRAQQQLVMALRGSQEGGGSAASNTINETSSIQGVPKHGEEAIGETLQRDAVAAAVSVAAAAVKDGEVR